MGASTPSNFRYPIGQTLTSVRNGAWLCPQAPCPSIKDGRTWAYSCLSGSMSILGGAIAKKSIGSVTQKSIGVVNKSIKWLSSTMCITLLTIFIMLTGDKLIISPPPLVLRVCTMDYFITPHRQQKQLYRLRRSPILLTISHQ